MELSKAVEIIENEYRLMNVTHDCGYRDIDPEYFTHIFTYSTYVNIVDRVGGGEGDGEYQHLVLKVTEGDDEAFVKYTGQYNSWDTGHWNDPRLVEPRKVEVTKYFNI